MERIVRMLAGLALVLAPRAPAETAVLDSGGRIHALQVGGTLIALQSGLEVRSAGGWYGGEWQERAGPSSSDGGLRKASMILDAGAGEFRFLTQVSENGGSVDLAVRVADASAVRMGSAALTFELPITDFSGGSFACSGPQEKAGRLPVRPGPSRVLWSGEAGTITIADAGGDVKLGLRLDRDRPVEIDDERPEHGIHYRIRVGIAGRELVQGGEAAIRCVLTPEVTADTSPAELAVDARGPLPRFDGFGGDYAFQLDSPVTEFTRRELRSAWARFEMKMIAWEPRDGPSADSNRHLIAAADRDGSDLHRSFVLARELQDAGTVLCMSLWKPAPWMFGVRYPGDELHGKIAPAEWPAAVAAIADHLLYLKEHYGVEPALFSFNEPDDAVDVGMSAEDQRDIARMLARQFAARGLRTRFLLGDVAKFRLPVSYLAPSLSDPEARAFVGAIGVHSWGGALVDQWEDWGRTAAAAGLPLLVTEAGLDANWHFIGGWLNTRAYALEEQRLFFNLLAHARPAALMPWEYTGDYALGKVSAGGSGRVLPTPRFHFLKQWCDLVPPACTLARVNTSSPAVMGAALLGGDPSGSRAWTVHVLNMGPPRSVTIRGLPSRPFQFREFWTDGTVGSSEVGIVAVRNGTCRFNVPARSLASLTTIPAGREAPL